MIIKIKKRLIPITLLVAFMGLSAIRGSELDGSRGILGTFIEEEEGEHLFSPPKPKEEQDRETYQFSEPITGSQKKTKEAMNATFYNVGQGNGAYVVDKYTGNTLVVDCGSAALPLNYRGRPEGGKALASQFSKKLINAYNDSSFKKGKSDLVLIVSHPDEDHYGLIKHFIEKHIEKFGERNSFAYLGGPIAKYYKGKKGLAFLGALKDIKTSTYFLSYRREENPSDFLKREDLNEPEDISRGDFNLQGELGRINAIKTPFILNTPLSQLSSPERNLSISIWAANAGHLDRYNIDSSQDRVWEEPALKEDLEDTNLNSAIVKIAYKGATFVLPGDATGGTTERMVNPRRRKERISSSTKSFQLRNNDEGTKLNFDDRITSLESLPPHDVTLMASHHGAASEDTNSKAWLDFIKPDRIIISAGRHMSDRHPPYFPVIQRFLNYVGNKKAAPHPITVFFGGPTTPSIVLEGLKNSDLLLGLSLDWMSPLDGLDLLELGNGYKNFNVPMPLYTTDNYEKIEISFSGGQGKPTILNVLLYPVDGADALKAESVNWGQTEDLPHERPQPSGSPDFGREEGEESKRGD